MTYRHERYIVDCDSDGNVQSLMRIVRTDAEGGELWGESYVDGEWVEDDRLVLQFVLYPPYQGSFISKEDAEAIIASGFEAREAH